MALLLSSLVWVAIPPAKSFAVLTLAVGVLFQAFVRAVLFQLYQRTEVLIKSANHPILHMPLNDVTSSLGAWGNERAAGSPLKRDHRARAHTPTQLTKKQCRQHTAAGVGFGLMHATMIFGSVLASGTSDPGVLYAASCTATPMVLVLAFLALAFTLLDVGLMMLTFLYLRRKDGHRLWVPLAMHAAASASVRAYFWGVTVVRRVYVRTLAASIHVQPLPRPTRRS